MKSEKIEGKNSFATEQNIKQQDQQQTRQILRRDAINNNNNKSTKGKTHFEKCNIDLSSCRWVVIAIPFVAWSESLSFGRSAIPWRYYTSHISIYTSFHLLQSLVEQFPFDSFRCSCDARSNRSIDAKLCGNVVSETKLLDWKNQIHFINSIVVLLANLAASRALKTNELKLNFPYSSSANVSQCDDFR